MVPTLTRRAVLRCVAAGPVFVWALGRSIASARLGHSVASARVGHGAVGGGVYLGPPRLQTLLAMVLAGGGEKDFKALTLFAVLAGSRANEALANLTKKAGAPAVKAFINAFDFFVADTLRLLEQTGTRLPATAEPDPKDGPALLAALRAAGIDERSGRYAVDYMLDRLVSRRLHARIRADLDAKYGTGTAVAFESALRATMRDLAQAGA